MTGSTSTDSERVVPPHSKGIKVIVVGLGIGGLAAAVECHRKGYTVIGFEKVATFRPFGECVMSCHVMATLDRSILYYPGEPY